MRAARHRLRSARGGQQGEGVVRQPAKRHYTGWQHFTEGGTDLRAAFDRAGLAGRLVLLAPGESADLTPAPRSA